MNNHDVDLKQDQMPSESPKDFRGSLKAQRVYALSMETKPGRRNMSSVRSSSRVEGGKDSGVRRDTWLCSPVCTIWATRPLSATAAQSTARMSWRLRVPRVGYVSSESFETISHLQQGQHQ